MMDAELGDDLLRAFGADLRDAILLSGFSGAAVMLGRMADGRYVVRKAAKASHLNDSLRDQVRRQTLLRERLSSAANVPAVLDDGMREGRYCFDMEFIPSRAASAHLAHCRLAEVAEFAHAMEGLMDLMAGQSPLSTPEVSPGVEVVLAKLQQIDQRTQGRFAEALSRLGEAVRQAAVLLPTRQTTAAHGDLTLENILIDRRGGLCLIDPIPSPFDHFWMDWAKLFQDCEGEWFLHRGQQIEPGICHWLRERLFARACAQSAHYASWHYLLLGLTFARILPYMHTPADERFVPQRLYRFTQLAIDQLERNAA